MKHTGSQFIDPRAFCHAYKDYDGQPVSVVQQMDVDEFLKMFLDKLDTQMKATKTEKIIERTFGGKVVSELIPKGCPHRK